MYTSGYAHRSSSFSSAASKIARVSTENTTAGLISEVVYREDQPMMTQLLLLPLLQQLGQQSRWQLWLTPQQKLSREWVQASGLPLTKVMQISQLSPCLTEFTLVSFQLRCRLYIARGARHKPKISVELILSRSPGEGFNRVISLEIFMAYFG